MRVLLIGEIDGNLDEGMRNISRSVYDHLRDQPKVDVKSLTPARALFNLIQLARWSPNLVHYLHGPSNISLVILRLLKLACRHSKTVMAFTHPDLDWLGLILLRHLQPDYCLVQSSRWQQILKDLTIPSQLLPLSGVDLDRFHPVHSDKKRDLRAELSLPVEKKIVLHVGHVKSNRNLEILIQLQGLPNIQVVILGSTTTVLDESIMFELLDVEMIVRICYFHNVEEFYQAADCYVFPIVDPSAAVEIPLSVLEAMATNLPVITTEFGGLADFFDAGGGLNYIDTSISIDLRDVISAALNCDNVKTRELVSCWSWQHISINLLNKYDELISG